MELRNPDLLQVCISYLFVTVTFTSLILLLPFLYLFSNFNILTSVAYQVAAVQLLINLTCGFFSPFGYK